MQLLRLEVSWILGVVNVECERVAMVCLVVNIVVELRNVAVGRGSAWVAYGVTVSGARAHWREDVLERVWLGDEVRVRVKVVVIS